jgi:hypothetical protein
MSGVNRRHSSAGSYGHDYASSSLSLHPLVAALGIRPSASSYSSIKVPSPQQVIPAESVIIVKELGAGEFGVVQQGVWTDENGEFRKCYRCQNMGLS